MFIKQSVENVNECISKSVIIKCKTLEIINQLDRSREIEIEIFILRN